MGICTTVTAATLLMAAPVAAAPATPAAHTETELRANGEPMPAADAAPVLTGQIDVGITAQRTAIADTASVSPRIRLGLRPRPEVEISAGFGVATLSQQIRSGTEPDVKSRAAVPGNFEIGVTTERRFRHDRGRATFGVLFALPMRPRGGASTQLAADLAVATRAGLDPWVFAPGTLGVVAPASIKGKLVRWLVLGGDGAVGGLMPAYEDPQKPGVVAQLRTTARVVLPWIAAGVAASVVYNGRQLGDHTQAAVTPFAELGLCRAGGRRLAGTAFGPHARCPAALSAALAINLDGPYGFVTPDAMRVWGLRVGLDWAVF